MPHVANEVEIKEMEAVVFANIDEEFYDPSDYETGTVGEYLRKECKEDFNRILGQAKQYTWDDFYRQYHADKANGGKDYGASSLIAFELLKSAMAKQKYRSYSVTPEDFEDVMQNLFVIIMEKIPLYDETRETKFSTYMSASITEVARKARNHGKTDYEIEHSKPVVYYDDTKTASGEPVEPQIPDAGSEITALLERKEIGKRSNRLEKALISIGITSLTNKETEKAILQNTVFFERLFGGIHDCCFVDVQEKLEERLNQSYDAPLGER